LSFVSHLLKKIKFNNLIPLFSLRVGKIALFDKALVAALARGALAMCAMWVGRISKFLCGG